MAQESIAASLVDPITYEVFTDPVIASDNHTYERDSILQWWAACAARNEPLLSPLTRERMTRELRPNMVVRQLVADLMEQQQRREAAEAESKRRAEEWRAGSPGLGVPNLSEEASSLAALGRVFAAVDPLRDLLQDLHWAPPQIVVMGNENTGKSTLLERICMMPLFPTDKSICTRMVIKICLRRGTVQIPQLEVRSMDGKTVHQTFAVPMDCAAQRIQEVMMQEVRKENGGRVAGVCRSKTLVLHVASPQVPNLDLVDLPGLVAASVQGEPEDMTHQTRSLVETYLDQHAAHSMYLVTVPANAAANQSIAMDIIQRRGLQNLTIGVFTKCDLVDVAVDSDDEDEDVRSRFQDLVDKLNQTAGDVIPLQPHGYVATMNKKPKKRFPSGHEALTYQAEKEFRWFMQRGLDRTANDSRTSAGALIARLMSMYYSYAMATWLPGVLRAIDDEKQRLEAADKNLGLPQAHDAAAIEVRQLMDAAAAAFKHILLEDAEVIARELQQLFTADNGFQNCRAGAIDRWTWQQARANLWQQHAIYLRSLISDAANITLNRVVTKLQADSSSFKWGRFDQVLQVFRSRLADVLSTCMEGTQAKVDAMLEHFYSMPWNPCIKTNCHPDSASKVRVEIDYRDFNNAVVQEVLGPLLATLMEFDVALHIPSQPSLWVESCAQNRVEIIRRLAAVESIETHVLHELGISCEISGWILASDREMANCDRLIDEEKAVIAAQEAEIAATRQELEECNLKCTRADEELAQMLRNHQRCNQQQPPKLDHTGPFVPFSTVVQNCSKRSSNEAAVTLWLNWTDATKSSHFPIQTRRAREARAAKQAKLQNTAQIEHACRRRQTQASSRVQELQQQRKHAHQRLYELLGVPFFEDENPKPTAKAGRCRTGFGSVFKL